MTNNEELAKVFAGYCQEAGIETNEYAILIVRAGDSAVRPEGFVVVEFHGKTLTFEMLEKASALFGTHKIDVGCDHGCASDPCHETNITFWGAKGL